MAEGGPIGGLVGRVREIQRLNQLIESARQGLSGVLVVRGEPGVGKTALLDHVAQGASGVRVLRAAGVQWEMELAFSGLQQLCSPLLDGPDGLDRLPEPQSRALSTAFGLTSGEPPDRFLVGLAALNLLSGAGSKQPLVCIVDDAHWLDQASAQTLVFVARRLLADPVVVLFAGRGDIEMLSGFPDLFLHGLGDRDARSLLDSLLPFVLDNEVRDRIVAETRGNPLAILELPRGLSPAELAGGFSLPSTMSVPAQVEETYRRRSLALPDPVRRLLLLAAAEPAGNPVVVIRAANGLGIDPATANAAPLDGLLDIGSRVTFRHPLVRSAVYHAASPEERRQIHSALASATDPESDPDRRAWHLAQATVGADEEVAAELERSAGRAQARGGLAAAAAFLQRASELTLDQESRARLTLSASQFKHLAGAHETALTMLTAAEAGPLNEMQRAQADLLRAEIAYTESRSSEAPRLLLRAATRLETLDLRMARDTHLDAIIAAHFAGRLSPGSLRDTSDAARKAPSSPKAPSAADLLLDGLATSIIEGYPAGAPILQGAVSEFRNSNASTQEELRWLWPAAHVAMSLFDDASYQALASRHIEIGRQAGLLAVLPTALTTGIVSLCFAGQLQEADQLTAELRTLSDAMGIPMPPYGPLFMAGWRGREDSLSALIDAVTIEVTARGEGGGLAFADYARAVLYNGLGRYDEALESAAGTDRFESEGFVIYTQGLAELVEASARAGKPGRSVEALDRLGEMVTVSDTDWGMGVLARCRAMLAGPGAAEDLYREAIERLGRTAIAPQLARTHLMYGEWLRRQNRRVDAREQLRIAHEMCAGMGLEGFAERARHELLATGETVRARTVATLTELTAQEAHIARLAATGQTNQEIGAQLFISARTVEWHLRKVFTKLGIASRRELRSSLGRLAPVDLTA